MFQNYWTFEFSAAALLQMGTKSSVSQTLFDDIVRQNIVELDMAPDEAFKDAIESCKSQVFHLSLFN